MSRCINIYFKKDCIVLKINEDARSNEIYNELQDKLPDLKDFYQDERTPILVTGKILKKAEIDTIQKMIQSIIRVRVDFDSPRNLGLHDIRRTFKKDIQISETKFYKGSIRSGQRMEFEGSIVIIGDVNDGAEVIAEDNIAVVGNLRGMAHAGAKGNVNAIIAANLIESPQIRIASIIRERERKEIETESYTYAYINDEGLIDMV